MSYARIANDRLYPDLEPERADDPARPLGLLARELAFRDPVTDGERVILVDPASGRRTGEIRLRD